MRIQDVMEILSVATRITKKPLPTSNAVSVKITNRSIIKSTHTTFLDLPNLPIAARNAQIFTDLNHSALFSTYQLCNNGYKP